MPEDEPGRYVDELREPLAALPHYFGAEIPYDPRSRRMPFGPVVTVVRGGLVRLLRWWLLSALERQDRVNRLLVRAIERLDERSPHALDERLSAIEESWRARDSAERAELLESTALAQAFASHDRFAGADAATIVELLRSRSRVLVMDLSWPALIGALRDAGAVVQGVDQDARTVEAARADGADALQRNPDVHVRSLADESLDGAVLVGSPLHASLGHVVVLLRQLRRALAAGAPLVIVAPNADSVSVGARDVWRDPAVRRPVPPALYAQVVELAGFARPEIETLRTASRQLSEEVGDPRLAENMRILNELFFGPEICAVIARK
ncbi:MAG TPA: class I SAM-dependent methyltransferase [Candidatus Limnocylindria bacterium]|jgi:SAM-dependent methyltransferase|nr:class I SAM-dependent methyltransferase [Candidatus Limnocylindria bacterium]